MPSKDYLVYRNGHPYFKRTVPAELRSIFGATAVWRRLRPDDLRSVAVLARAHAAELDTQFALLRREMRAKHQAVQLHDHHIPRLCARFDAITRTVDAEVRAGLSREERADHRALMIEAEAQAKEALAYSDTDAIAETATVLLEAEGLQQPTSAQLLRDLLLALLRQDVETTRKLVAAAQGEPVAIPPVPMPANAPLALHDLVASWKKAQSPVEKTVWTMETTIQRFEGVCGLLAVGEITGEHARQFRDYLLDERKLARKTTRTYIALLKALVQHAIDEGTLSLTSNPFVGVRVGRLSANRRKRRRSLTPAELQTLFSSRVFTANWRPRARVGEAAFWLPLLALFTGARLEELAQLQAGDVYRVGEVDFIRIHAFDQKHRVKTETSWRLVPLHREILAAGFVGYAKSVQAAGGARLFPTLRPHPKYGTLGHEYSKWFGRYMTSCGLDDPTIDFHALRSTFKDLCRLAGVPEDVHDALTGHAGEGREVSRGYGAEQYPPPPLVKAIAAITAPDLDLKHLHRVERAAQ